MEKLGEPINTIGDLISSGIEEESDALSDALNDALSDAIKSRIKSELFLLVINKGITLQTIKDRFGIERATAQRDMKLLKKIGFVKFEGASKTGKYIATEKIQNVKLNKNVTTF